jgi:hypothetical protein
VAVGQIGDVDLVAALFLGLEDELDIAPVGHGLRIRGAVSNAD